MNFQKYAIILGFCKLGHIYGGTKNIDDIHNSGINLHRTLSNGTQSFKSNINVKLKIYHKLWCENCMVIVTVLCCNSIVNSFKTTLKRTCIVFTSNYQLVM